MNQRYKLYDIKRNAEHALRFFFLYHCIYSNKGGIRMKF